MSVLLYIVAWQFEVPWNYTALLFGILSDCSNSSWNICLSLNLEFNACSYNPSQCRIARVLFARNILSDIRMKEPCFSHWNSHSQGRKRGPIACYIGIMSAPYYCVAILYPNFRLAFIVVGREKGTLRTCISPLCSLIKAHPSYAERRL